MKKYDTAEEALRLVASGQRVFLHGGAATPHRLLRALLARAGELRDMELVCLSTLGDLGLQHPDVQRSFFLNSLFVSDNVRDVVNGPGGDHVPVFLSEIPRLFDDRTLPLDVALLHLSPPDRHGFCSLGVSVDVARAAARNARVLIAQINPRMPRTHGEGQVHIDRLDACVEVDDPLPESPASGPIGPLEQRIGAHCAQLIEDRSTLQVGIGTIPDAVLSALADHRDLGVHTEMCSDGLIGLIERGAITGRYKRKHPGRIVTSFAVGSRRLYDLVDDDPAFAFLDAQYVNDGDVIRSNPKVIALNSAIEIDLTGQVCSDSIGTRQYSGVGGQMDFMRGAALSDGGKPIIALLSTTRGGGSKIVPMLRPGAGVVTTRAHVHYVVTEHGIAYLKGKNLHQRAAALIAIAHPDHQEALEKAAFERFGTRMTPGRTPGS